MVCFINRTVLAALCTHTRLVSTIQHNRKLVTLEWHQPKHNVSWDIFDSPLLLGCGPTLESRTLTGGHARPARFHQRALAGNLESSEM